ncbi:MAG: mandelate racemase/muconate lactonizing enzyme family protein [Chitinophagaceae bacterium]|nr:mandelate racemase/muconate lactonizing enzyme family protein [Chitinophagaceae bacterium]
MSTRRSFIRNAGIGLSSPLFFSFNTEEKYRVPTEKGVVVTDIDLHIIKVNERGDWYFIELKTNKGFTGLGECSHAFSKSLQDAQSMLKNEVKSFFELIKDQSPFNIELFRNRGLAKADNKLRRTVFSGIEQALWDLNGKILGVPVYNLLGGKLQDKLRVYANINRATNDRDNKGRRPVASFQRNAELAVKNGFNALKLAPFDEMRPLNNASETDIRDDIDHAIKCIEGVRSTIGNRIDLLIDVHSHLDVPLSIETAKRLEPSKLYWFEEPVNPDKFRTETATIKKSISQVLAGGEAIFGRHDYEELIHNRALGIIMPDVKHCGGLLELKYIAAMAETAGIKVAPHNPSGPVATAASIAICATLPNFDILEYAFGEVPWSRDLVIPSEQFDNGFLNISDKPGTGITLNYKLINQHK